MKKQHNVILEPPAIGRVTAHRERERRARNPGSLAATAWHKNVTPKHGGHMG